MNIIVFIKQIPDTLEIKIDPETNTLVREGMRTITNVFDLYAIEEGIRLKEKCGGVVTAISMGPPQAISSLREAIAMGVDRAILASSRAFAGSDTWATSYILSNAVKKLGVYDILICGKQAVDGDTAQVGPGIAAHLNIPQVTYVKKIREINKRSATVLRMTEDGYDVISVKLPCLITVVKEINTPRYPSLAGKIKAKRTKIETWDDVALGCDPKKIGLAGSPTQVEKIFPPTMVRMGSVLPATDDNIEKVIEELELGKEVQCNT